MFELAQLINSYLAAEIDYQTLRREFVLRFLAVRCEDSVTDAAVVQIESLCADVAEGEIVSEDSLKTTLRAIPYISQSAPVILGSAPYSLIASSGTSSKIIPGASLVSGAPLRILPEVVHA